MPDGSISIQCENVTPPLKWAGGKRWLMGRVSPLIPRTFSRLVEPFLGSAATFFEINPASALLADINLELVVFYRALRDRPHDVQRHLEAHSILHSKDYYYSVRAQTPVDDAEVAARLLYLNRTCWNALYRVNKKGEFNVPKGTKDKVLLPTDNFTAASRRLQRARIERSDFYDTIGLTTEGDFIFADPPYFSPSSAGTFLKYTASQFTWAAQVNLADAIKAAHQRGAEFMVTNAACPDLKSLYAGVGHMTEISRHSVISGTASGRKPTTELLWTSFPLAL